MRSRAYRGSATGLGLRYLSMVLEEGVGRSLRPLLESSREGTGCMLNWKASGLREEDPWRMVCPRCSGTD